jgi:hypothetical protein
MVRGSSTRCDSPPPLTIQVAGARNGVERSQERSRAVIVPATEWLAPGPSGIAIQRSETGRSLIQGGGEVAVDAGKGQENTKVKI